VLVQLEIEAVETWHRKASAMVKRLEEAASRMTAAGKPVPAQIQTWTQDIREMRGGLATELKRLRGAG
jgi:hypothetical protein